MPYQFSASTCGSPASAVVGTSGSSGECSAPASATARSAPDRAGGRSTGRSANIIWTGPAIRSVTAGAEPR